MSVVKGKRNQSDVEFFDHAYKMVEHITKFLLADLGIKKTYRDLKVFTYKAHMEEDDKEELKHLVDKYDLEGNYICSYVSISDAARVCNVHKTQITQCCKLNPKYHSAGKFQWRYKGDTPPEKYVYRKCLKVIQYTPSFEIVDIYNSCKDAHNKTGLAAAYIASCCHVDGVSALGYIWRFTE